jgi:hypothetical protein
MTKAPETIWVGPSRDDKGEFWDVGHWDSEPDPNCVPYVPRDLHLAKVAAVVEVAGDAAADAYDAQDLPTGSDLAGYIRALTPSAATAALERVKREARVEALRDAADMLENGNGIGGQLSAKRVRAMIEKEQTDE